MPSNLKFYCLRQGPTQILMPETESEIRRTLNEMTLAKEIPSQFWSDAIAQAGVV